jgi:hypothetical protein
MTSFTKSMFDDIKTSLENNSKSGGNFRDLLKTEKGNSYLVRFIPNVKEPKRTFYHYYHHGWQSEKTGQYISATCPTTWGDRCPICEERIKLYRDGTEESKKLAYLLKRKENWLVNIYVITDPKNQENNNQVKILRYGKQVQKIIDDAMSGEDADEFGAAIFDLSKDGCSLRLKVEENEGGFPSYTSSRFLTKKAIPGMTADKIEEVHNSVFELDKLFDLMTYEDIAEMLNEHTTLNVETNNASTKKTSSKSNTSNTSNINDDDSNDDDSNDDDSNDDDSNDDDSNDDDSNDDDDDDTDAKIQDLLKDL